jgi:NTP pyrophosphatase (non-canonical NTP hydrolase)
MIENQKSISDWAAKEFGYPTGKRIIDRMLEEVDELKDVDLSNNNTSFNEVSNECADILIVMYIVANTFGFNLHACVDHKMEINRGRKWKRKEDGTGYHVKE